MFEIQTLNLTDTVDPVNCEVSGWGSRSWQDAITATSISSLFGGVACPSQPVPGPDKGELHCQWASASAKCVTRTVKSSPTRNVATPVSNASLACPALSESGVLYWIEVYYRALVRLDYGLYMRRRSVHVQRFPKTLDLPGVFLQRIE
ncbi:hypothetical protein PHYPSEUDO_004866 [Phytophthora pseudosyringae]|uniref:Uncharacterized protein n=1 Tax=Phytophthora pseudosyringae TaxID=221518 RepID=A0A8T1VM87_9STRA|nr:hypothetical protein PHYPSEUDO_004866 [Phytophthora pseudosyringae]